MSRPPGAAATPPNLAGPEAAMEEILRTVPSISEQAATDGVTILTLPVEQLPNAVGAALGRPGSRFADLFATAGDPLTLRVIIALDRDARYVVLETRLAARTMPWLSDVTPAAFVEECELFEQFGLQPPEGHLLNRLAAAPVSSPEHPHPGEHELPGRDTHAAHTVAGHAFEFPVGPVRGAGLESLYYGLVTSGEEVVDLYLHTWHKYRGIEHRLRGMRPAAALFLVERAEGLSAVASSIAFVSAVESAQGIGVPYAVARARAIYLELERLYNHAQCAAALAQSTGLTVGQAQAEIALEQLLRLNADVGGHRYLFGAVGLATHGRPVDVEALHALLPQARGELCRVLDALLETNSFLDRLEATGFVSAEDASALGLVGPVARACGAPVDARVDHPVARHPLPDVSAVVRESGDCLARLLVRRDEVDQSARLIAMLSAGELDLSTAPGEPRGWGLGAAESPRGETLAWVELDELGLITRARLRTASSRNWRAFDDAVRAQNVFTDVPIIEASFWLTVAGRVL